VELPSLRDERPVIFMVHRPDVETKFANRFITEYSPRPGTVRSKLGRDEIDEPWTRNRPAVVLVLVRRSAALAEHVERDLALMRAQYSPLHGFAGRDGLAAGFCAAAGCGAIPASRPAPT